jgi:hypothetical protein
MFYRCFQESSGAALRTAIGCCAQIVAAVLAQTDAIATASADGGAMAHRSQHREQQSEEPMRQPECANRTKRRWPGDYVIAKAEGLGIFRAPARPRNQREFPIGGKRGKRVTDPSESEVRHCDDGWAGGSTSDDADFAEIALNSEARHLRAVADVLECIIPPVASGPQRDCRGAEQKANDRQHGEQLPASFYGGRMSHEIEIVTKGVERSRAREKE